MDDVVFRVDAIDPCDGDSYEIGTFADEKNAEYVRRKYEYTTDTGYSVAKITPVYLRDKDHDLLKKDDKNVYNRIGYFGVIDDKKFIMYRDRIAFNDKTISRYCDEIDNLISKFDYIYNPVAEVDEDIHLLYTEVPFAETDTEMETEAYSKFSKYLFSK